MSASVDYTYINISIWKLYINIRDIEQSDQAGRSQRSRGFGANSSKKYISIIDIYEVVDILSLFPSDFDKRTKANRERG